MLVVILIVFIVLVVFMVGIFSMLIIELGNISYTSPVLKNFFVLSPELSKESSGEYLSIEAITDEIDGVNFHLEDNFKRTRVVVLYLNKLEFRECFLYIFLSRSEIALDEIE